MSNRKTHCTNYVVIVAGGSGRRMGGDVPKQFLPVAGKPVLMHTIERFAEYDNSLGIILVLPVEHHAYWQTLCADHAFDIPHTVVAGGSSRYESSARGLAAITGDACTLVAIHDGVRPFVSLETIGRCFDAAMRCGAAIPVLPLVDSLRHVCADGSSECVMRSDYRVVQTPQVFTLNVVRKAFAGGFSESFTDDASVVEASGCTITMVEGNRENIKITTPFDLVVAEAMLKEAGRG